MIDIVDSSAVNTRRRKEKYRERLFKSVSSSYRSLEWARVLYAKLVAEYCGPNYGRVEGRKVKYVNKNAQFIQAYTLLLAGSRPQVSIETEYRDLIPFANNWEVNLNNLLKEIQIEQPLQACVLDSLILMGIVKVHYAQSGFVVNELDVLADPGIPFVSSLDLNDWVHDSNAKVYERCRYAGDKYRIPFSWLKRGLESGIYNEEAISELSATQKPAYDDGRTDTLSHGFEGMEDDEMEPGIDVADIFDFEDQVIRVYAVEDTRTMKLKGIELGDDVEWDGLETGPYHLMRLMPVPNNILPKSPLGDVEAIDRFANNMARKVARQAHSQKENLCYSPGGQQSAQMLTNSADRESIQVSSPADVAVIKQGGVDPSTSATLANFLNLFDEMGGNLKSILGLAPQAGTLGQEQIIQQAGTRMGNALQARVIGETERIIANLSRLMWNDNYMEMKGTRVVDASGTTPIKVTADWKPGKRDGAIEQYKFTINPYSMRLQTPAEKAMATTQLLQTVYVPLMPMLQQQGATIDMFAITEMFAKNMNLPDLREIISFPMTSLYPNSQDDQATKSPQSDRTYRRVNVGTEGMDQSATSNWQEFKQ